MKLVIAIVQSDDAQKTAEALTAAGISSTRVASTGGFLHRGNVTLLIGIDEARVPEALKVIRDTCHERSLGGLPLIAEPGEFFTAYPVEVQVGGATVFVVPVDSFEKI